MEKKKERGEGDLRRFQKENKKRRKRKREKGEGGDHIFTATSPFSLCFYAHSFSVCPFFLCFFVAQSPEI
jgi:hypothetical protein